MFVLSFLSALFLLTLQRYPQNSDHEQTVNVRLSNTSIAPTTGSPNLRVLQSIISIAPCVSDGQPIAGAMVAEYSPASSNHQVEEHKTVHTAQANVGMAS